MDEADQTLGGGDSRVFDIREAVHVDSMPANPYEEHSIMCTCERCTTEAKQFSEQQRQAFWQTHNGYVLNVDRVNDRHNVLCECAPCEWQRHRIGYSKAGADVIIID
jgi:hypothetical protein